MDPEVSQWVVSPLRSASLRRDSPRVTEAEVVELKPAIPDWELIEPDGVQRLERGFRFPDFAGALAFTDWVGALAEEGSFVMAAKTDSLLGFRFPST